MTQDTVVAGVSGAERFDAPRRTPAEARNVATVREIFGAFSRSDFSLMRQKMAPGASSWVVGFSRETLGNNFANPDFVPQLFCNGMHFHIKQVAAEGNLVTVEWDDEAMTSTGKHYRNTGASFVTFDDEGRVTSYREYIDPANFFKVM